jgi:uncharacterized protein YceK
MIVAGGDTMRLWVGIVGVLLLAASLLAGCSSVDSRPSEFDGMSADEVGCTLLYGSDTTYVVGPLGPSDFEVIEPNEWSSFRIFRTALNIGFSISTEKSGTDGSLPINDLPDDHVVAWREMMDPGNPGYKIKCWRGDG